MSTVTPTGGAPVAAQPAQPTPVPAQAEPAVLKQLESTTSLRGQILGHTADRSAIAQTEAGRLHIKLPASLPPGTQVKIEVVQTQPDLKVIVSQTGQKGAQAPLPPAVVAPQISAGGEAPLPRPGTILQAVLTTGGQTAAAQQAPLQAPTGAGQPVAAGPQAAAPRTGQPAAPTQPQTVPTATGQPAAGQTAPQQPPPQQVAPQQAAPQQAAQTPPRAAGITVPTASPLPAQPAIARPATGQTAPPPSAQSAPQAASQQTPASQAPAPQARLAPQALPGQGGGVQGQPSQAQAPQASNAPAQVTGQAAGQTPQATAAPQRPAQAALTGSGLQGLQGLGQRVEVAVRVVQTAPTGTSPTSSPGNNAAQPAPGSGGAIQAQVTGHTAGGQSILTTPAGTLTLQGTGRLPLGSTLTLEPVSKADRAGGTAAGKATPTLQSANPARALPSLEQAMQALAAADPAAAQNVVQNAIARPGPQLTGAMLFFMTALRGGDARQWLGETANRLLERSPVGKAALDQLGDDFSNLTRVGRDQNGVDWRAFYIPLYDGEQYDQLRLYLRQPADGENENGESRGGARFLMDVTLTKLGPLQLDGLVRDKRVDLMLRTARPLPEPTRAGILELYAETMERTGYQGKVSFQHLPELPPLPFPDDEGPGYRKGQERRDA
ncbi:MAG: hypothetical protein NXI16_15440 [Alphaproteobacteria bacterium]|nr:hypothetical protein [Alphaproteobacteria bacterium]